MKNNSKWFTIKKYVDQDTGEIITKHEAENNYQTIKTLKNVEIKESYNKNRILEKIGYRTITAICIRKPKQRKFEWLAQ